jgi:UTP:GlnB (protein PII) uridylyltransferase
VIVPPSPSSWLARLEDDIARRLADVDFERRLVDEPEPLPRPLRRGRRVAITTRVSFDEDAAGARTIVEIETADQPGVLRRITLAFAALNVPIELARLMTEGRRVLDVFYVPHLDEVRREQLAALIRRYLRRA